MMVTAWAFHRRYVTLGVAWVGEQHAKTRWQCCAGRSAGALLERCSVTGNAGQLAMLGKCGFKVQEDAM